MRKFDVQYVATKMSRVHGWVPAPFPGKFPTRVALRIIYHDGRRKEYIGKPTRGFGRWVSQLRYQSGIAIFGVWEFDRTHLVREGTWLGFEARENPTTNVSAGLALYYHPWDSWGQAQSWTAWERPFWTKRIVVDRQVHVVYSPLEKLKVSEHIEPFKIWVRAHRGDGQVNP